ncbi:MAG: tetratricopeptide repeat protein, partial [Pseudomonadota bacterium]
NNLASLLLERGKYDEALEIAMIFDGTDNPFFADTLAWAHYKSGNLAEASRYMRLAVRDLPNNSDVLYHAGVIDAAEGRNATARERLLKAKELHGKSVQTPLATIDQALVGLKTEQE